MADNNGSGTTKTRRIKSPGGGTSDTRPTGNGAGGTKPASDDGAKSDGPAKTGLVNAEAGVFMEDPICGWLVVVKGPGRGAICTVHGGLNSVGRDASNRVPLDFGDGTISGNKHCVIVYDEVERMFAIKHEEGKNLTRVGGKAAMELTPLGSGDEITIGETTLRFVALCGPDFDWPDTADDETA